MKKIVKFNHIASTICVFVEASYNIIDMYKSVINRNPSKLFLILLKSINQVAQILNYYC